MRPEGGCAVEPWGIKHIEDNLSFLFQKIISGRFLASPTVSLGRMKARLQVCIDGNARVMKIERRGDRVDKLMFLFGVDTSYGSKQIQSRTN